MKYDEILDVTKLRCPSPIIDTKKKLKNMLPNSTLLVKTSDPSFSIDFAVYAKQTGDKILETWSEGDITFNLIKVSLSHSDREPQ